MSNDRIPEMCRVWQVQQALGYETQHAARRMLERLDKKGIIKLRRVGHSVFVSVDELNKLFGMNMRPPETPPAGPERAVG